MVQRFRTLNPRKRTWVYAGLALAAGVGLVTSRPRKGLGGAGSARPRTLGLGARLLLVGGAAAGLATPLRRLAHEAGVTFHVEQRLDPAVVARFRPTVALVAADIVPPHAAAFVARVCGAGARLVWILPAGASPSIAASLVTAGAEIFRVDALSIPRGPDGAHPSVMGYAGLAGAIWRWLG